MGGITVYLGWKGRYFSNFWFRHEKFFECRVLALKESFDEKDKLTVNGSALKYFTNTDNHKDSYKGTLYTCKQMMEVGQSLQV